MELKLSLKLFNSNSTKGCRWQRLGAPAAAPAVSAASTVPLPPAPAAAVPTPSAAAR